MLNKRVSHMVSLALFILPFVSSVQADASPSPEGAVVYIISPAHGEAVGENVTVKFGLKGMGISPAGPDKTNTGHHHLLIDVDELPALDKPMGKEVRHFGGGETETTITLPKGKHTLQLILGNHLHIPHDPPVISEKITIHVR